ncbi:MAG TPA: polyprenyl synthetase family protein [Myxococcota bacterium]|nr:polyprenyl synthetase family protein [Myxococcota bacterium]
MKAPQRMSFREIRLGPGFDREVEQFLRYVDRRLVPFMKQAVDQLPEPKLLREAVSTQIRTGGKRLRAALCAVSCEMFCGDPIRALAYAAAIEHLQNFTLIHDDIADGDAERRSHPTIWKLYGVPHAITIGDVFVALGCTTILRSIYPDSVKVRLVRAIAEYGLEIAAGQVMDVEFRTAEHVSTADYLTCTRRKTGAFLAMAVVGGGIVGGADDAQLESLAHYAGLAGIAFQIKDDLLDLSGAKGREVGEDIREGKITAVAIHALNRASPAQRERLLGILRKRRRATTSQDVAWVIDLYTKTEAVRAADVMANRMIQSASQHLLALPENDARARFLQISRYLAQRMR